MKRKLFGLIMIIVLLLSATSTVFAAGPAEYTIDVRNRTGAPVELNYRGADGIIRWTTVPEGVSSLTLTEGVYAYWADPICGHIAGTMNLSQQRQVLWISCDDGIPVLGLVRPVKKNGALALFGCSGGRVEPGDMGYYFSFTDFGPIQGFASETFWQDPNMTYQEFLAARPNRIGEYGCMNWDLASLWTSQYPNQYVWVD